MFDEPEGSYILRGDPGPFAPLEKLVEYLERLRGLSNCSEVVAERATIRDYIQVRRQRPMRGDDFAKFRERLSFLMLDH